VELARRPCGGIGNAPYSVGKCPIPSCTPPPMASREAGPPSGGHRRPPGGSESLRKIGTMPPHGRPRNGGTGSSPVRGHRQNFTKALRAAGRPPVASGGWLGLSGGYGRRGARRNRGVTRRNRALPAREDARKGWERWNWLAARAGASSEFFEGSPSRRWAVGGLRRVAPPLEAMGGGVHDGIGALPDRIGLCPHVTVPTRAGNGGTGSPPVRGHRQNFTKALRAAGRPPGGLRRVARPLWRLGAAGCTTE